MAVGYKKEAIMNFFGNYWYGCEIAYSEEDVPLLTGGAIKKALRFCREDNIFVCNGDTFFDADLKEMNHFHRTMQADLTLALKPMSNAHRYGMVQADGGKVTSFLPAGQASDGMINGGVYLMKKNLLDQIIEQAFSFETDVLEKQAGKINMAAFCSKGYFIDIGVEEDYHRAQTEFIGKWHGGKAVFFDRDGTINKEKDYVYRIEDFEFLPGIPEKIKEYNDEGYKVIVVTNQAGIARGYYSEEEMHTLHRHINDRLAAIGAHIDAFYFCPHHPDITGPCQCRKPEPGMIKQAIHDFNIDVTQSLLYGDKPWDIEAGRRCGIKSILLRTNAGI